MPCIVLTSAEFKCIGIWENGYLRKNNKAGNERISESPTEVIKKPVMLEFLGIHPETSYYEKDLEGAIISHLTD